MLPLHPNHLFSAVKWVEAHIRAAGDAAAVGQDPGGQTPAPAIGDPAQILRGVAHDLFGDWGHFVAGTLHSEAAEGAGQIDALRRELARVESVLRQILGETKAKRSEEQDAKVGVEQPQDHGQGVMENLGKATEKYHEMLAATSLRG